MRSRYLSIGWFTLFIYLLAIHFLASAILFYHSRDDGGFFMLWSFIHHSPYTKFWLILLGSLILYPILSLYYLFKRSTMISLKKLVGFWAIACSTFLYGIFYFFQIILHVKQPNERQSVVLQEFLRSGSELVYHTFYWIMIILFVFGVISFIISSFFDRKNQRKE
ncbi:hypothetical protein SAMN05421852_11854 [Thermoflavimicrobium dichotomicum]|uniref:Uncharacterized protein n=1 Tax=Thermoflavimicrobium dichotomicum TaxID=46223 RepID=A0A1I3TMM3_9BACL|nr:hypothetical protein SAMN05421852_11854 [Thermoflavimicrobium dichotomicum]